MLRRLFLILFLLLVVAPAVFLYAAMQPEPAVAQRRASTPEDAARSRAILRELNHLTDADGRGSIRLTESDMNGILAFAGRGLAFFRGAVDVAPDSLRVALAADATRLPGGGWLNLRVGVEPSSSGLDFSSVEVGPIRLPASLVLPAAALVLNIVFGNDLGQIATSSIDGVAIDGDAAVFGIGLTGEGRDVLARGARDTVEAVSGARGQAVRDDYLAFRQAAEDGRLAPTGSALPYVRFAVEEAHRRGSDSDTDEVVSALFALAIYCGHVRFQDLVGDVVPRPLRSQPTECEGTTLAGRGDLRQHFVISAALEAASDSVVAFAVGEFKELLDSNRGGSGFSFTDIAADRAGIRFARALLDADADRRRRMLETLTREDAVMPPLDGLPPDMSEGEFRRRFGDVDSAAYRETLAEIDRRIDALPIHDVAR